jgi:hypothetical protein
MSTPNILSRVFSFLLHEDKKAEKFMGDSEEVREKLDKRIEEVTKATLNGETDWFLRVVKENPECAAQVVKECILKDD